MAPMTPVPSPPSSASVPQARVNPEIIKNFVQYSGQMFDRYEEIYDSYEEERKANDSDVYLADTAVIVPKAAGDGKTGDQWVDGEPQAVPVTTT